MYTYERGFYERICRNRLDSQRMQENQYSVEERKWVVIEIKGKYSDAKIFTKLVEQGAIEQIRNVCNQEFTKGSKIRIMPDVHIGVGCTVGTTMTIRDKVVPSLVGVDISCGMLTTKIIEKENIQFDKLDKVIHRNVPSGFDTRKQVHPFVEEYRLKEKLKKLRCIEAGASINIDRALLSVGTLGGGNHFLELNQSNKGEVFLVVHTGSRNIGGQIAKHYQNLAVAKLGAESDKVKTLIESTIKQLEEEGRQAEIKKAIKRIRKEYAYKGEKNLAYLEGQDMKDYLHDVGIMQEYSELNRRAITHTIMVGMRWTEDFSFATIHNYIDLENMILRKGAISAQLDEMVLIPINMREGSILARGLGNADWNYSAPHGAGRLMSRKEAKDKIDFEAFKESMHGIYTTSVAPSTIDEAPMAYKPIESILDNIVDTVEVIDILKPIYNFKSS